MDTLKYKKETQTLVKFYECFCQSKHTNQNTIIKNLNYNNSIFSYEISLCKTCKENISYCFDKLNQCPHEEKPRCRKCKNPCYEKTHWKYTAKVMRYSGIKLGITKLLNIK